jgi:hypothetical protein
MTRRRCSGPWWARDFVLVKLPSYAEVTSSDDAAARAFSCAEFTREWCPFVPPYDDALWHVASSRPDFLFRPGAPVRDTKNLVGEICAALVRDPDDVALTSARARSAFVCWHLAQRTTLTQLCELAGLHGV